MISEEASISIETNPSTQMPRGISRRRYVGLVSMLMRFVAAISIQFDEDLYLPARQAFNGSTVRTQAHACICCVVLADPQRIAAIEQVKALGSEHQFRARIHNRNGLHDPEIKRRSRRRVKRVPLHPGRTRRYRVSSSAVNV